MSNKYIKRYRFSDEKIREVIRYFSCDIEAAKVSMLTGINRVTVNRIYKALRQRMAVICEAESSFASGCIEMDESYFGARRIRGIRGRGARGKKIVFGLIKRGGKVYTQLVKTCSKQELYPIIKAHVEENATLFTDSFKTYDGLVNFGYKEHYRIKHSDNEFANGINHINGIENLWGGAKVRLAKFRGISKDSFYLHLKECEFRFNYRKENIYRFLLNSLRKSPAILS